MRHKKKFREMSMEEILEISYDMWGRSIEEYKDLLDKKDSSRNLYKDAMKYRYYHSKLTGDLSLELYRRYNDILKKDDNSGGRVLYLAALTHDIKKIDKKHSLAGAEWIRRNIRDFFNIEDVDVEDIATLIRFHKSSINKKDEFRDENIGILILILQMADGISKLKEKSIYKSVDDEKIRKKLMEVINDFNNNDN